MAEIKKRPLLNGILILFLTAMIFANIGGNMYEGLMPLYLKDLDASIPQIGLFFTLAQIVPLLLQILGGWISDSLGRLRAIVDTATNHLQLGRCSPLGRRHCHAGIEADRGGQRRERQAGAFP